MTPFESSEKLKIWSDVNPAVFLEVKLTNVLDPFYADCSAFVDEHGGLCPRIGFILDDAVLY